jgi:hypothetical protein
MLASTRNLTTQVRTASSVNILLGVLLLFSPWAYGYDAWPAVLNSVIVGTLIAALAANRVESPGSKTALSGINFALALWTIGSPWVFGYAANVGGVRDNLILGIAIAALAMWSGGATIVARLSAASHAARGGIRDNPTQLRQARTAIGTGLQPPSD